MRRTTSPDQILRNLRNLIDEAEIVLARGRGALADEQLLELRERMQAGFNRLREYSGGMSERLHDAREDVEQRLRGYYEEIEERLRTGTEKTTEAVRSHPYRSALIAGGIALIIGGLCSRFRSRR